MNGNQVRDTKFSSSRQAFSAYDAVEVDDLLRRVAAELDADRSARPLIENATFRRPTRTGQPGYDVDAVDWLLDQLRRQEDHSEQAELNADPWGDLAVAQVNSGRGSDRAEECGCAWRDFGQQPGIYLRWERVRGRFRSARWEFELRAADQETIVSLRGWPIYGPFAVSAGGRSFTARTPGIPGRSTADSWPPGIAELAACSWRDQNGHYAAETMKSSAQRREARLVRELVDETGTPILYISGSNFDYRACARVTFTDQRWLRFLVRGTKRGNDIVTAVDRGNAIMTALDQAGNKVARYRITRKDWLNGLMVEAEIAVHPSRKLTDELMLAIAISPPWLYHYFDTPK